MDSSAMMGSFSALREVEAKLLGPDPDTKAGKMLLAEVDIVANSKVVVAKRNFIISS